jgi:hypothetical protein
MSTIHPVVPNGNQDGRRPALSVIVAIVSDTTDGRIDPRHLRGSLQALADQVDPPEMEILVPYCAEFDGLDELHKQFAGVRFLRVDPPRGYTGRGGSREHHDELRAQGIRLAQGDVVALLEDHARPDVHWCKNILEAHSKPFAAIGGAIENGVDRPLNWAVYFCDFGKYQNPVPEGESEFASDANVAYKRTALGKIRSIWSERFCETTVNWELRSRGEKLALSPRIIVFQHRYNLRLAHALRERYIWGRSYARTRSLMLSGTRRAVYAALSPLLPGILFVRLARRALQRRRNHWEFAKAAPAIALLNLCWAAGECTGYLIGRGAAHQPAAERPRPNSPVADPADSNSKIEALDSYLENEPA